jgi:hypothetical protein
MPAKRGNLNALRHGLYRKHFTPEITPELKRMPTDSLLSEIAALRLCAARALDLYESSATDEDRSRAILTAVHALEAAAGAISRNNLLSGNAPVISDLWEAIKKANELDHIPDVI